MFQYAAGRALAVAQGLPLYLDLSDFQGYHLHNGFELSRVFNGLFELAEEHQLQQVIGWQACRPVRRILKHRQFALFRDKRFIVEPHFHYWPDFFAIRHSCYLVGYWQSENYFKSIEKIIRQDFRFKERLYGRNAELAKLIDENNSVSLHIRRGDYVHNAATNATHGLVSLAYYKGAIARIAKEVGAPFFVIFSDDIDWARQNLEISWPCCFVGDNQGVDSYLDMQLMSLCRHHIIANSSFSWWGAWLGSWPEKQVFYPAHWFAKGNFDTVTLCPPDWIRLDC